MVHNPIDSKAFEPDATNGTAMKLAAPSVEICRVINPPEKCDCETERKTAKKWI